MYMFMLLFFISSAVCPWLCRSRVSLPAHLESPHLMLVDVTSVRSGCMWTTQLVSADPPELGNHLALHYSLEPKAQSGHQ